MDQQQFTLKDGQALEKFLLTRIEALEKMARITSDAMEKSTELARHGLEKRLDGMNEIREQLRDQADTFVTGVEHEALCARIDRMEAEIRIQLRDYADRSVTKAEYGVACSQMAALDKEIHGLRESRAELMGKASQSSVDTARTMALIGVAVSIISIILKFVG